MEGAEKSSPHIVANKVLVENRKQATEIICWCVYCFWPKFLYVQLPPEHSVKEKREISTTRHPSSQKGWPVYLPVYLVFYMMSWRESTLNKTAKKIQISGKGVRVRHCYLTHQIVSQLVSQKQRKKTHQNAEFGFHNAKNSWSISAWFSLMQQDWNF